MNCLVCVLWCLILNVSSGQLNGDPAPGRSPGPPSTAPSADKTSWTSDKINDQTNLNAAATSNDIIGVDNYDDDAYRRSSDDIHQVPQNTMNRKVTTAASSATKPIRQPDKLVDKLTNEFVNHKPCKNLSVNEYLLMKKHSPEIVKVEKSSTATQTNESSSTSVRIDVTHSAFNLNGGLVRNVIYTGKRLPCTIFN